MFNPSSSEYGATREVSIRVFSQNLYEKEANHDGTMSRNGYKSLTIPKGLYRALEQYVAQSKGGYVSISEVVREALREYLNKN